VTLESASSASERVIALKRLHEGQAHVRKNSKRFNVLACGRRWGKTTLGLDVLIDGPKGALEGYPVAWFAPNSKLFDEVWWQAVTLLRPIARRIDSQKNRIDLLTGSPIDFWTLHNTDDPGRGRKYGTVVIDEAAIIPGERLRRQWLEAIRPTLTDYKGGAWFVSSPKGGNYFKEIYDTATGDDWARWQLPTVNNPFIDPSEIEKARLGLPSIVFEQEYLARFVDVEGARIKREWLRYGEAPERFDRLTMGVDLAISTRDDADYTAAVVLGANAGNTWVLHAERTRTGFNGALAFIESIARKYNPSIVAVESVQYQAAVVEQLLRNTNLPVQAIKPDRDKLTRFLPLEARYEQGLVWHTGNLQDYEDELLSFPHGAHDDLVDASAYAYNVLGGTQPRVRSL
jgi:predicted phage terminase large subunit-like protein